MEKISIFLTNLGEYVNGCLVGEWVKLPVPDDKLAEVVARIGGNGQEYFISDYETLFSNLHIGKYASITELNHLAEKVEELADFDYDKLAAALECESNTTIVEVLGLIEQLDDFDLLTDVFDDAALGEYFTEAGCILHGVVDHILRYFDFEAYGRDIRLESNICYTRYGAVVDNR